MVAILACAVVCTLTYANYHFASRNPGGNDFLPRWAGTRLYLTEGLSPYGSQASAEIQRMIYGRQAIVGEDQSLFVYPFYSIPLFAPFSLISDYSVARAAWMLVLELCILWLAWVGVSLSKCRPSPLALGGLVLFGAFWYHNVRSVINGNPALLCGAFIAAVLLALRDRRDMLAGFLLALATFKPQMVVLLVPLALFWAFSLQRWRFFWSIVVGVLVLLTTSSVILPGWIVPAIEQITAYPDYTLPGTPASIFTAWWGDSGRILGGLLTAALVILLASEWWKVRGKDFAGFMWTVFLTLAATNLIGVRTATDNFSALYPALILIIATWVRRPEGTWARLVMVSMPALLVGMWILFLSSLQDGAVEHGIMFFPLPLLTIAGLYTIRRRMVDVI
jgi:hypothetical protein